MLILHRWKLCILPCVLALAYAQDKPNSDVLVFVDGEKLIGELKSATGDTVTFKSNMGFDVTVPWAKVQQITSSKKFAAIPKNLTLENKDNASKVPQGTVEVANQTLEVNAAPKQSIPLKDISNVVDQSSFERSLKRQSLAEGWKGGGSFGFSLTESSVKNRAITSGFEISRATPSESWMRVKNRTTLGFNSVYGKTISGPNETKFVLLHSDLVHDHFMSQRWFAFAGASFDHNSAQGLDLLQAYGGGLGAVLYQTERTRFDARAGIGYMRQSYGDPALNRNLVGSRINQSLTHTFSNGIVFFEQAGVRPAWNSLENTFGGFVMSLTVPVYHRIGLNVSSFDNYVNNPPPGFQKNTFQLTVGVNYALK